MYGRPSFIDEFKQAINTDRLITRLILVNVMVFIVLNLIAVIAFLATGNREIATATLGKVMAWIIMPGDPLTLLSRPWTLITNFFTHFQFMHLLFNMLCLYWFGTILNDFLGPRKVLPLYFYGGIAGAIIYFAAASLFPKVVSATGAEGASAAVLAIMIGSATLLPDYPVKVLLIGEVKLKFVAAFFVVINMLQVLLTHSPNLGEPMAHLGGALFGFVYIRQIKVGHDWSKPFNAIVDFFVAIPDRLTRKKGPHMAYKRSDDPNQRTLRKVSSPSINKDKQSRIDSILDKINQSGYDSLSKEEKEFLFRSSKED